MVALTDPRPDWHDQAACLTVEPELFYPDNRKGSRNGGRDAKAVCDSCPVIQDCRSWGIQHERFGIWGGLDAAELDAERRARGIRLAEPMRSGERAAAHRAQAVMRLHSDGVHPRDIAAAVGIAVRNVYRTIALAEEAR